MRLLGLAIQLVGTVWAAYVLLAVFFSWLVQPPPQQFDDIGLRHLDNPYLMPIVAVALVASLIAAAMSPRFAAAGLVVAACCTAVGLIAFSTKPPEILGVTLGLNVAAASALIFAGSIIQLTAGRSGLRTITRTSR